MPLYNVMHFTIFLSLWRPIHWTIVTDVHVNSLLTCIVPLTVNGFVTVHLTLRYCTSVPSIAAAPAMMADPTRSNIFDPQKRKKVCLTYNQFIVSHAESGNMSVRLSSEPHPGLSFISRWGGERGEGQQLLDYNNFLVPCILVEEERQRQGEKER